MTVDNYCVTRLRGLPVPGQLCHEVGHPAGRTAALRKSADLLAVIYNTSAELTVPSRARKGYIQRLDYQWFERISQGVSHETCWFTFVVFLYSAVRVLYPCCYPVGSYAFIGAGRSYSPGAKIPR